MTVCVCIASRGRPTELQHTIEQTLRLATIPSTHIAVALDADDYNYGSAQFLPNTEFQYRWTVSCAEREISLGAKYNRAASRAYEDASLFVMGVDDAYMNVEGWDQRLLDAAALFPDGIGVVHYHSRGSLYDLPMGYALTKGWIEQVGFFCPPYFPFWWHDTWVDELAKFTGRYVWADVPWHLHGKSETEGHKTQRIREVSWWAKFFDETRPSRVAKAKEIIAKLDNPPWLNNQLMAEIPKWCDLLLQRNSMCRNEGWKFEKRFGAEIVADPGYDQIKAEAMAMLT
jgi:hypothetical protein